MAGELCRKIRSAKVCNVQGNHKSSLSRKAMYFPFAWLTPRFRAAPGPLFSWAKSRIRSLNEPRYSSVPSVEPSSTTMTSKSLKDWPQTEVRVWGKQERRLKVGITTENNI